MTPETRSTLAAIRRCATAAGRNACGCFALEGTRLVERAVRAGLTLRHCGASAAYLADPTPRTRNLLAALPIRCVLLPDEAVAEFSGGRDTGHIFAIVEQPPPLAPPSRGTVLVAVDVLDPGNAGALVRTALAAGADGMVAVGVTDPFHPKAARTSMGSVCRLPVRRARDLAEARALLHGWRFLGTVCQGGKPLNTAAMGADAVAIVLGSEAFGLSEEDEGLLDGRISIPMAEGVDSYSVNAAAAILLHARLHG